MKFRKRPIVIEAIQYEGEKDFNLLRLFVGNDFPLHRLGGDVLGISTLESDLQRVVSGDWLIRGVKGEFYPCKPDIFDMTYEQVDGPIDSPAPVAKGSVTKRANMEETWKYIREGYIDVTEFEKWLKAHGVEVTE